MRINAYVAFATGISRRAADDVITDGKVLINGRPVPLGYSVQQNDIVTLNNEPLSLPKQLKTIMLHKPAGYVCSRNGQGSQTIYDLLPKNLYPLKPIGRLDKDSSGLVLLTNDGKLANAITHPSFNKKKIYEVVLDHKLSIKDLQRISIEGVQLNDGPSKLGIKKISKDNLRWRIEMSEGRNRQIRRTFEKLGYKVLQLHRTQIGRYYLGTLRAGKYRTI